MNPISTPLGSQFINFCKQNNYNEPALEVDNENMFEGELQKQINLTYFILHNRDTKDQQPMGYWNLFPGSHLLAIIQNGKTDFKLTKFAIELLLKDGYDVNAKVNPKGTALFYTLRDREYTPITLLLLNWKAHLMKPAIAAESSVGSENIKDAEMVAIKLNPQRKANYEFAMRQIEEINKINSSEAK